MDTTPSPASPSPASPTPVAPTPTPAPVGTNEGVVTISIDDFAKVQLRVGTVLEAVPHTKGNRLLVLQVDMGNGEKRQICAGIRQHACDLALQHPRCFQPAVLRQGQKLVIGDAAPQKERQT